MRFALLLLTAIAVSAGCGGDNAGTVDLNDTTPPSRVAMDAFYTNRAGQGVTVSVSPTSGAKSVTLDNLPDIALLAVAEDPESAIPRLDIRGESTVWCEGTDLGRSKHATWLKPDVGGDELRESLREQPCDASGVPPCGPISQAPGP
jgi:hypothetical protein